MAKGKLPPIFTPNTLESMIEYTIISNILDKICEMTTKPWECQREFKTWGTKWKRTIDKTNEWATWQWMNEKINKEIFAILKQTIKIPKENMEDYHWVMFTHTMDFFLKSASLKKPIP
jgi:hypothetical protein